MSGQNTSSAVMQQRTEAHDSLDDFPTQPWATRALMEHVILPLYLTSRSDIKRMTCWEPCANRGHMVLPLGEYFHEVFASDIHDYGAGYAQHDFLMPYNPCGLPDWIISNPPFRLAEQIIQRARDIARTGVAMIVRTSFLEGVGRYNSLFSISPPTIVAQFSERVPMVKGRLTATGSTATSYCWLVWITGMTRRPMIWIPPCRRQLEKEGDYPNG
jgi:hypothetical protein